MTEEEKAALEAAEGKEEAKGDAEEAESKAKDEEEAEDESGEDDSGEGDDSKKPPENKIDYKAELEKEKERRIKAEKILAGKRFKNAERKRKGEDGDDDDTEEDIDDDKPLTVKQLDQILAKERQQTLKDLQAGRIREIAKQLATEDDEAELIIEIHKNRVFPADLTLEEQLEEAFVIANRKKLVGERNEALRALKGKKGADNNSASAHKDAPKPGQPKLSPADAQVIKEAGFSWNSTNRRFEKKLPNGNLLVKDPKSGNVQLIKAAK